MTAPNIAWVSDITYIWTNEGWVYLAEIKDLYSKEIVGYALNKRMTADLVCQAPSNAYGLPFNLDIWDFGELDLSRA